MSNIEGVYVDGCFQFRGMKVKEISLCRGLGLVAENHIKMVSDGLESDEYIHWIDGKGICYEDDCLIGETSYKAFKYLDTLDWTHNHRFFVQVS